MKKIVVLDSKVMGDFCFNRLNQYGNVEIYKSTSRDELIERIKDAQIIINTQAVLNKEVLEHAEKLELICQMTTGFNIIDIEYAREKGIAVTNVAGYSTHTVAQHSIALLLSLMNKIVIQDKFVKDGEFSKLNTFASPYNNPAQLFGKTVGIIGLGNIGRQAAKVFDAFGAKVIYYSPSGNKQDVPYEMVSFEKLIKESDVISIYASLNKKTEGLINYEVLKMMKKDALIVNVGRGPIIVEKDLTRALNENLIGGAALDVFTVEPIEAYNPLLHLDNPSKIVLTPHSAWLSAEAKETLFSGVLSNIDSFYSGGIENRIETPLDILIKEKNILFA
ncbi:NAD(P)-dependent oxidoreductase [Clostridium massiliamazoniense]|uniref:NAD(P)-dependent oxidoreductase n=1 Tax=Clostridium massiliamazoniense TaxID=1347366 RepID=UPI0006D82E0F|nr:NAD(P)-dependent oxidoreductase [Clostridium massiliamazoniense]